jgi:hypothetical protein
VHWLPKKDRPRGVVGNIMRKAQQDRHNREIKNQDQTQVVPWLCQWIKAIRSAWSTGV